MIKNIILKGIATYRTGATLETDKKVNLIYGLNGVGKSTLSKYLYSIQNNDTDNPYDYSQCRIVTPDPLSEYEFLVYNTKFVEDNFYEKNAQKGIFTLSKENKEVEIAISILEESINQYISYYNETQLAIENLNKIHDHDYKSAIQNIWDSKYKYYDNDTIIQEIVGKGVGRNQVKYFDLVQNAKYDENCKDVATIRFEYEALSNHQEKLPFAPDIHNGITEIERDPILQKQIVGSSNSSISEFIESLQNTDWVKTGRHYLGILNNKICPFCQRDGVSESFIAELERFFDNSYERDIDTLEKLSKKLSLNRENLQKFIIDLNVFFDRYQFLAKEFKEPLQQNFADLDKILRSNENILSQKIKEPSVPVSLHDSSIYFDHIGTIINNLNSAIRDFNEKIDNIENEKTILKRSYWCAIHKEYKKTLEEYIDKNKQYFEQIKKINEQLNKQTKINEENVASLKEKRKQVANIDDAIENINGKLNDVGLGHLQIEKYQENDDSEPLYRVIRNDEQDTDFRSLSEGEKMMVTFLYFVERCKGSATRENQSKKKIVVIDDPISSLSHIFVYNVALIINKEFTSWNRLNNRNEHGADGHPYPYDQVFILTHNLYFYYELAERDRSKREVFQKLFRIQKKDNDSSFVDLKYDEIHNDYQAYWTIVKRARESDHPLLANCMRNILEYFFVFTENLNLNSVFSKGELSSIDFQSFYRYINRESHSVGQNACDTKEFDYDRLLELFKNVFVATHYETHYDTMMKIR